MSRDARKARTAAEPAVPPFDSAPRLLGRSAAVFCSNLPFLAGLTLAVSIPGNLLVQFAGYVLNVPAEGILSYFFLEIGDMVFGAWAAASVIYAVTAKARDGRLPGFAESLGWGRRRWGAMLWNDFKVEITVGLRLLLLVVPGAIAAVRLALVEPVVALEGGSATDPLRRSEELTEGIRWRVFWVLAPLALAGLVGNYAVLGALPGAGHSRLLLALADSALAVLAQWTTVAALLMYLGITASRASSRESRRDRRSGSRV
jgi:hypothetical protein